MHIKGFKFFIICVCLLYSSASFAFEKVYDSLSFSLASASYKGKLDHHVDFNGTTQSASLGIKKQKGTLEFVLEHWTIPNSNYKGMNKAQANVFKGMYFYDVFAFPTFFTTISFGVGATLDSLGHYDVIDYYDASELDAPYLPHYLKDDFKVTSGRKSFSLNGYEAGVRYEWNMKPVIIGLQQTYFRKEFKILSAYIHSEHENGSYVNAKSDHLLRKHKYEGYGFSFMAGVQF